MAALEKVEFFERMHNQGLALTFDDVRLETGISEVTASEIDITSPFSRNLDLKAPIVSAAMDTVTTSDMAIAVAKLGGLGVIHAGLSVEEQKHEVRRVKLVLNGLVEEPITVDEDQSLESVLNMCAEKKYDFRTFPVTGEGGRFVGLLTQNDFDFCGEVSQPISKVMTSLPNVESAQGRITVEEAYALMQKKKKKTLPLLDHDGMIVGLYIFSDVKRIVEDNSGTYNIDDMNRLRVAAAVPTDDEAVERVKGMRKYVDAVVLDTAQGDSKFAFRTLKKLKEEFSELDIVVGNVSAGPSARRLAEEGADGIKVGQGPGSICTTRTETGIGCPQVTAVYECARAVREAGLDVPICADGGIKDPGDISLAIAAGASSVMMGSMLAATKEAPGELIELENGARVKLYRGMGSPSAMRESAASRKRYGAEGRGEPLAEGIESYVPYKGSVVEVLDRYIKALRKSMSYVGSSSIPAHQTETRFFQITNAGIRESRPHDVKVITK
jgi:IMP dehydrogenase